MTLTPGMRATLDSTEILNALHSPRRDELLLGAAFHPEKDSVLVTFADGRSWWLDAALLADPSGDGCMADLNRLAIIDSGQTLRCGDRFEAASDWIRDVARPTHSHRPTC